MNTFSASGSQVSDLKLKACSVLLISLLAACSVFTISLLTADSFYTGGEGGI